MLTVIYTFVDAFEQWLTPKFRPMITAKSAGDDAPIHEGEETLVTSGA